MGTEEIKASEAFLTIITDSYFKEEACLEELKFARDIGKPIIHIIKDGTTIPEGFILEGENTLRFFISVEEIKEDLIKLVRRKFHN